MTSCVSKMADEEAQEDELLALESIYEDVRTFMRSPGEKGGQLNVSLDLPDDFLLKIRSAHVPTSLRNRTKESAEIEGGSDSGNANDFVYVEVKHLPPIVLNFVLPDNYPSKEPPSYTLSCKWLTKLQLSKLCKNLDKVWEEQGPEEIIYSWVQFIKDDTLKLLDVQSPYKVALIKRNRAPVDGRAIQDVGSYPLMVTAIFDYEEQEKERVFNSTFFLCDVCFTVKIGSVCMKFYDCSHVFCCECLKDYFTVQIQDGAVKNLACPTSKCESQALPSQVQSLVSPELFAKYDKFLLQTTLATMADIVYCPRSECQSPVMLEKESSIGECPKCNYVFCIFCNKASHGVSPCSIRNTDFKKLRDEYVHSSEEDRSFMEKRYGKKMLKRVFEEVVSDEWIKDNAKTCPSCGCSIQKVEGCNKMTCSKCRIHFCWLCSVKLPNGDPYSHFNELDSKCFNKLFEGVDSFDEDDDDWMWDL